MPALIFRITKCGEFINQFTERSIKIKGAIFSAFFFLKKFPQTG